MLRYFVSLAVLSAGVVWLSLGAPVFGGPGLLEPEPIDYGEDFLHDPGKYCDLSDPSCVDAVETAVAATRPTPPPRDPRIREVFLEDPVIQALIGEGEEWSDYWVQIDQYSRPLHGGENGVAIILLAEPVSYEGEVLVGSDPCGAYNIEGHVDPDQPCLDKERDFSVAVRSFTDARAIRATVNPEQRYVFNIRAMDIDQYSIDQQIAQIEAERN